MRLGLLCFDIFVFLSETQIEANTVITVGDRMFFRDARFCPNLFKFAQILIAFAKFHLNLPKSNQFCIKNLLP